MGLADWARNLDDRVVGAAERDPKVRRRGEAIARTVLAVAVVAVVVASYVGGRHTHVSWAVPAVAVVVLAGVSLRCVLRR
jgi:hypothetical protein